MNRFLYHIIYALIYPAACLPLGWLQRIAGGLFYWVYYVARYRRKLTRNNLQNAFPDLSEVDLIALEKKFYRHFCDYFFETIKLMRISDTEMKKRFIFRNMETVQSFLDVNQPVILMLGHYGNWEWVTSITLWTRNEPPVTIGQIYRPLKNQVFDKLFLNLRKRFHSVGFPKIDIYREIIRMRRAGQNWLLGFISDQKPSANSLHYWTEFLHQDTPALIGAERIAKQTGAAVCYLDITQVKRGFYEGKVELISADPKETPEFEITEKYMRAMERSILRNPALWLWSHNRWKYKRIDQS
ncbi:MAG: lysophospholipid acyltransferase family protein [Dysgonamonadaceae bacterium]|jgi:KDO2-lipid IV(A) lauroyltransferase|nr:lysophospholipid acyltransferase family protein [Dysgonamonadaceae bacterium]